MEDLSLERHETPGRLRVAFTLNGQRTSVSVNSDELMLDTLRDSLRLTGTKRGCEVGVCGICTVLVDGRPISACLLLTVLVDGSAVQTIEGIRGDDLGRQLQDSFVVCGGFQCGICTPGQVLTAYALLARDPNPSESSIKHWMNGNLCRCTGYEAILESVMHASERVG